MTTIDFIIRLKNGYLAGREEIDTLHSVMTVKIADILKKEHYIKDYSVVDLGNNKKGLKVMLQYNAMQPALTDVKLVSKPGRRIYMKVDELKPVQGGMGIAILTTSKGILSDRQARKQSIGGEVLFKIW